MYIGCRLGLLNEISERGYNNLRCLGRCEAASVSTARTPIHMWYMHIWEREQRMGLAG